MNGISAGAFPDHFLREDGRRTATANERLLLMLLRRDGAQSRADLARVTGLAAHSVTRLLEPLMERGLVVEEAPKANGPGKPSAPLRLAPDAAYGVGLSVMTDAVSLVLLDFAGGVLATRSAPLADVAIMPAMAQIGALIAATIAETGLDRARMVGIGVGVTGYFIGDGARVNPPALLEPWALVPLDQVMADALGAPVWVDNDGNVAVIGEAMLGAGRHAANLAYLYFSAGFGGGLIANGQPVRGRNGNAGEFASMLPAGWAQPNLERLRAVMVEEGGRYPDVKTMIGNFSCALPGVARWLDEVTPSLNLVVSGISAVLDPDLVVLGGRLPAVLAEAIIPRLNFTNPLRRGYFRPTPMVVASTIPADAAAAGAATLPLRAAFF